MEEGLYSKHSKNLVDRKRIYHICEKKERLRKEQIERDLERANQQKLNQNVNKDGYEIDPDFGKKMKNKGKKTKKKNTVKESSDEN